MSDVIKYLLVTTAMLLSYQAYGACSPAPTTGNDRINCDSSTTGDFIAFIGNDTIEVIGADMGNVFGEEFTEGTGITGDNDRIIVRGGANVSLIAGESFTTTGGNRGGDDYINVGGSSSRSVSGENMYGGNNVGGRDEIFITNGANITSVVGDDFLGGGNANRGGSDKINVFGGSNVINVFGDVFSEGNNHRGGNDLITIDNSTVNTIAGEVFNGGTGNIGGNDIVRLTSAQITGDILLNTGSDTLKFFNLDSRLLGIADGGDDASSADGYIDTIEIINSKGTMAQFEAMAPNLQNFEYFSFLRGSNIDLEGGYNSPVYERFTIDPFSTVSASQVGRYIFNGDLYHDGMIDLINDRVGNHFVVAKNLKGKGAYRFDTDFSTLTSDYVTINGDANAQGNIQINPTFSTGATSLGEILLIEMPNDSNKADESFSLIARQQYNGNEKLGRFANTPFVWEVRTSGNNWVLALASTRPPVEPLDPDVDPITPIDPANPLEPVDPVEPNIPITPIIPPKPPVIAEVPAYASLPAIGAELAKSNTNTLHSRLGEIRRKDKGFDESKANTWIKANMNSVSFGANSSFDVSGQYGGVNFGVDKKFTLNNALFFSHIYTGLFAGYKTGQLQTSGDGRDYIAFESAHIDIDTLSFGGYASFFNSSGSYMDMVVQYSTLNAAVSGVGIETATDGYSLSGSVEFGHSFNLKQNWVVEPQGQMKLVHMAWDNLNDGKSKVSFQDHNYIISRAGLRFEKTIKNKNAELKPWAYMGGVYEWSEAPEITYANVPFKSQDYHLTAEAKLGVTAAMDENLQLYASGGYLNDFKQYEAISGSLGIRLQW